MTVRNVFQSKQRQQVISTGPYAAIRHPMYAGVFLMSLFTPLALGSYWAMVVIIPLVVIIVFRILNEGEALSQDLARYEEYCSKVRYRLVRCVS